MTLDHEKAKEKTIMEQREFTGTLLVSYLQTRGFSVFPKNNGGRLVIFIVSGKGLSEAIEGFYQNPSIPILTFCEAYRSLRSALFNLKGARG